MFRFLNRITCIFTASFITTQANAENLYDLYQLAQNEDALIQSAGAYLEATQENKQIVRSTLLPQANVAGSAEKLDTDTQSGSYDTGQVALNVTVPLYDRVNRKTYEKTLHDISSAEAQYIADKQSLILRIAQAYFNVLSFEEDLGYSQAEIQAITKQKDEAEARYKVGLLSIIDVHEAQASYDAAIASSISLKKGLEDAKEALREIIGRIPKKLDKLSDDLALLLPEPADIEYWSQKAIQENPLVLAAAEAIKASGSNIDMQQSERYPTLDLIGSTSSLIYGHAPDNLDDANSSSVRLELNLPLYTSGRMAASIRQASSQLRGQQFELENAIRTTTNAARTAYRGVVSSISEVKALRAAKQSAHSSLGSVEAGYKSGTRTLGDVLDAQRDFYNARRDLAKARYQYVLNLYSLQHTVGILDAEFIKSTLHMFELSG